MTLPTQQTIATVWRVAYARPAVQAEVDSTALQLRAQFVRAHGQPTGEVTTLRPGGIFLSGLERPR